MVGCNYNTAVFLLSAANTDQLPADIGAEVGFIGRSNAGKSSAINAITGINGLARVSKMPGRTQLINLFTLDDQRRLVDLPGYGYAKVPLAVKERWQKAVNGYLQTRRCLRGLVLVMDIRHPLQELDRQIINWATVCNLPVHILLTKVDKLKKYPARATLNQMREAIQIYNDKVTVQLFSSLTHDGLEDARAQLDNWFMRL
ncbi:MAG: ribosome biogenesis GTP-binding protein YihA/YsxC [Gammaproteobacteria bacterium]